MHEGMKESRRGNVPTLAKMVEENAAVPKGVFSRYNEPLITAEWAVTIFREARTAGLITPRRAQPLAQEVGDDATIP